MSYEIYCPYCNHGYDLCHDDGAFYNDGETDVEECPNCSKKYLVRSSLSWDFDAEKAKCLNDGKHDWQPSSGYPREFFFGRFTCSLCGEEERRDEEGRAKAIRERNK